MSNSRITRRALLRDAAAVGAGSVALGLGPVRSALASSTSRPTVAVLGGGVGGLSAAHELIERGFDVTVYERRALGGKARSMDVPGTGTGGRRPLPGEHGARAVFGWYRNLPDLLERIPTGSASTVNDNLVTSPKIVYARDGGRPDWTVPTHLDARPWTPAQVIDSARDLLEGGVRMEPQELAYFLDRATVFFSSCDERRLGQWEKTSWRDFIAADRFSSDYGKVFGDAIAGPLMAAKAREKSTRAMGLAAESLIYSLLGRTTGPIARIFNAPTNEAWIDPWVAYLREQGVNFRLGCEVTGFELDRGRIAAARVNGPGGPELAHADWFICSVPAERVPRLLGPDLLSADPRLAGIARLVTNRYHGVQFFLRKPTPIVNGHLLYTDSPWGLVSVSQAQFWAGRDFARDYGDGTVRDCLSVDIGQFRNPGIVYGKPADAIRTQEELVREVWEQLKQHLNDTGETTLSDSDVVSWFVDPGLEFHPDRDSTSEDRMFISTPGIWSTRPRVTTAIPNLFLAADYVQVPSDLSTMDGANEAARRAVGALIAAAGSSAEPARVLPPYRFPEWDALKRVDAQRYRLGQKNLFDVPPALVPRGLLLTA